MTRCRERAEYGSSLHISAASNVAREMPSSRISNKAGSSRLWQAKKMHRVQRHSLVAVVARLSQDQPLEHFLCSRYLSAATLVFFGLKNSFLVSLEFIYFSIRVDAFSKLLQTNNHNIHIESLHVPTFYLLKGF